MGREVEVLHLRDAEVKEEEEKDILTTHLAFDKVCWEESETYDMIATLRFSMYAHYDLVSWFTLGLLWT